MHQGERLRQKYGEDYYQRLGKLGGNALKAKQGSLYYQRIGKKGGQATASARSPTYFSELGKRGGAANIEKYGLTYFSEMGKRGGKTTKQRQGAEFYRRIGKKGGSTKRKPKAAGEQQLSPAARRQRKGNAILPQGTSLPSHLLRELDSRLTTLNEAKRARESGEQAEERYQEALCWFQGQNIRLTTNDAGDFTIGK